MRSASCFAAVLLMSPLCASAQSGPPGWSAGGAVVVSQTAYRGSDTRVIPVPALRYESSRVYLLGLELGVHIASNQRWQTDVFVSARLDGADDIDVIGLANEIERDDSLDFGARVVYRGDALVAGATLRRDALGISDGTELELEIAQAYNAGRTLLTPRLGVRLLDSKLANYYYGILANERIAGAPPYRPGSAAIAEVGLTALRPLRGGRWALFSQLTVGRLPGELSDSPLVDGTTIGSFIAGATYQF